MVQRVRPTVIIQRYARRLLAILERNRLHFARVLARIRNLQGGPGSLREQRRQRRQQHANYWAIQANRIEASGLNQAELAQAGSLRRRPLSDSLIWLTNMHNAGHGPSREGEWNLVQFRPSGPGTGLPRTGYLRASVDPEAGYEEDQVHFGNPLVWSQNR